MRISAYVDEVGYIPFEQDAANLFFGRWRDVFGDPVIASDMTDGIAHYKSASYQPITRYWITYSTVRTAYTNTVLSFHSIS